MALSSLPAQRSFGATTRPRRMVAATAFGVSGFLRVHRLLHLGGVSRPERHEDWRAELLVWRQRRELPLAVLFARILGRFPRTPLENYRLGGRLGRHSHRRFDFVDSRRISFHLLLLSRRLLQGILGDPINCAVGEPRKKISR